MYGILQKKLLTKCHFACIRIYCTGGYDRLERVFGETRNRNKELDDLFTPKQNRARSIPVLKHFIKESHLNDLKAFIPYKYFLPKRRLTPRHLYLLDKQIAKSAVSHIMPILTENKEQIVCETNAGLGLITFELLEQGIKLVRLYEACPDFRLLLMDFNKMYPNRVELFVKDIFNVATLAYLDKYDGGDRVEQVLSGVPKRNWDDDPVMTIVGPMPNLLFINYLLKMLALQQGIAAYGRIQIFAFMRPVDYIKCTSVPGMSLHTYQIFSVLFQLFFDCELLGKYPRKSFLPWETKLKNAQHVRPHSKVDLDHLYLVRLNLKKTLPVAPKHLLHLYYFVKQGFLKGKTKVIPTVEKWLPGIGVNLIAPQVERREKSFPNMNIYTEFGQLTATEILEIFLEMVDSPEYENSPLSGLVESYLLKTETIESDMANKKGGRHIENLREIFS